MWEVIRQKYQYAGGCARYMFDWNVVELQRELQIQIGRVREWTAFIESSIAGSSANIPVNTLMQRFSVDGQKMPMCTAVSTFVLLHAYQIYPQEVTDAVTTVAVSTNDRAAQGWAFELSQLDLIRSALYKNKKRRNRRRRRPTVIVNSKLCFIPRAETYFNGKIVVGDVINGTVIWCLESNHGYYDAALYFDETLITLQFITVVAEATHSSLIKKLEYYVRLLYMALTLIKKVKVNRIVHLGIAENYDMLVFGNAADANKKSRRRHCCMVPEIEVAKSSGPLKLSKSGKCVVELRT